MARSNVFQKLVRELAGAENPAALLGETDDAEVYRKLASPEALGAAAHDALGELAFLAVGADGTIGDEEEVLLRDWITLLDGGSGNYGKRFDEYSDRKTREGRLTRLNAIATALTSSTARRLGYALVFALTSADMARSPREERFEVDVAKALELDEAQVAELERLVMSKLTVR